MKGKTLLLLFMALWLCASPLWAQKNADDSQRQRWMTEIRNYKHEYLTRELKLSARQQADFFQCYDNMDDELAEVNKEIRDLEQRVSDNKKATEAEIAAAAKAVYEQKSREGEIEMRYYEEFKNILTPRQLLRLRSAERRFTASMVRHHNRLRKNADKK